MVWLGSSLQLYYLSQYLKNAVFFNFLLRRAVFGRDPVYLLNICGFPTVRKAAKKTVDLLVTNTSLYEYHA